MLRQKLFKAIKIALTSTRYGLYNDFEYNIDSMNIVFPAAWMSPAEMIEIEGRDEGFITYKVVIQLMQMAKKITPELKEQHWAQMEREAIDITAELSKDSSIYEIENIKLAPSEYTLSKHGEISMRLSFNARMHFYRIT